MTTSGQPQSAESRLIVTAHTDVEPVPSRGDLLVRRVFEAGRTPFESSFQFVLHNRIPAGGANQRHVHEDVEKVYYFLSGSGSVSCGPWTKDVQGGDFLFFPAAIEHEIHADADADLDFIVCAARTLEAPRGLEGA
ncbi:MAG: cupin domain-containing protein [Dehalococcoidia bacterium]|nr:cupin domain-containing protein [Dehalococcoidia bacterium]